MIIKKQLVKIIEKNHFNKVWDISCNWVEKTQCSQVITNHKNKNIKNYKMNKQKIIVDNCKNSWWNS